MNSVIFGDKLILLYPDGFHIMGSTEKAEGFCYNYESQGISMYGESYVVKYDRTFYYLNFYARRELKSESLDVWGKIISSAKWA